MILARRSQTSRVAATRSSRCSMTSASRRKTAQRQASPSTRSSTTPRAAADRSATEPSRASERACTNCTDKEFVAAHSEGHHGQPGARIDGPRWQIAADNPVRLDAAHEAAADAQRKAQAFAAGVGPKLGRLIRLTEPSTEARMHRTGLRPMAAAAAAGVDHMQIEPGEHEVSASIDATFALELT